MTSNESIFWIGHASFYIKANGSTIFIDPFRVSDKVKEKADLILITHAHFDHNSKPDIEKVRTSETKFIASEKCLDAKAYKGAQLSRPGFKTTFNGIGIEAIAAYNVKEERKQFHPKAENWVGYIIDTGNMRIYHAGDTDMIPEMKSLKDIDMALLPMGGTYTMALDEAISAAKEIAPKKVVPMHYKMVLGKDKSQELESSIRSKLANVHIMKEVQEPAYSF